MARLTYITGPVRSGKSRMALELAEAAGGPVAFVATCRPDAGDPEMAARLARHRAERPAHWTLLEAPGDVAAALAALATLDRAPAFVLLDCLTLWLSDRLDREDEALLAEWDGVLRALKAGPWDAAVVGNEVGWAPVPDHAVLRRFRDLAGWAGQRSAAAADAVWLAVAGCRLTLR